MKSVFSRKRFLRFYVVLGVKNVNISDYFVWLQYLQTYFTRIKQVFICKILFILDKNKQIQLARTSAISITHCNQNRNICFYKQNSIKTEKGFSAIPLFKYLAQD